MATGSRSERLWVWLYALALAGITTIPYLIGLMNQGDGFEFTGFVFGINDGNSYIAKMLSGHAGSWLFSTPYTAFPQRGVIAFLPYLLLGKLAGASNVHTQLVLIFHLFRVVSVLLLVWATYHFISQFFEKRLYRWTGLILITVGGGLGWLLLLGGREEWLGSIPLEFYSPETFGFLAVYGLPHLALARALLLWGFVIVLRTITLDGTQDPASPHGSVFLRSTISPGLLLGGLWIGVGIAQPITLLLAWLITGLFLVFTAIYQLWSVRIPGSTGKGYWWKAFWVSLLGGIVSSPLVIYTAYHYLTDPFLKLWGEQNLLPSPHPGHYLIAYGLLIPLVLVGTIAGLRRYPLKIILPVTWFLVFPFLAYAPVSIQRRLPEGVWVAIVILALCGIASLARRWVIFDKLTYLLLLLLLPSSILLLIGGVGAASRVAEPVYRPAEEVEAFLRLGIEAETDSIVLSSFETGNALPAWAPLRVVIGHGPESVEFTERENDIARFFSNDFSDPERSKIMGALGVRYVIWGPAERELGSWDPRTSGSLILLFRQGDISVFQVAHP